jgi:hypothetical protein
MAASVTTSSTCTSALELSPTTEVPPHRRRHIRSEARRALEILGHAIEYLADEYLHDEGSTISANDGRLLAIQVLMSANREIYFSCPEVPSLKERVRTFFLRLRTKSPDTCRISNARVLSAENELPEVREES